MTALIVFCFLVLIGLSLVVAASAGAKARSFEKHADQAIDLTGGER